MEKLSDEQLQQWIDSLSPDFGETDYGPIGLALLELQQLRAARAADRERVMSTVGQLFRDGLRERGFKNCLGIEGDKIIDAVASRVADALAVPGLPSLSDTDRRTLEWLRGVMAYTADGDSGGMAARANATIDRLLSDRSASPRPFLNDTDRRHLVALRSFIAGIDGQRGHGNDWSAELALLDRLLESP